MTIGKSRFYISYSLNSYSLFFHSICGNSAYILGSAVEIESGLKQFLSIFSTDRTPNTVDIIRIFCHLLTHSDSECVLNAAGTLGTIVCRFHTLNL
jgi:hypothetical protein